MRTKTISITSGKGGVGKTTIISNLAYSLSLAGHRVLILDGDLGMSNVDIVFGVKPEHNVLSVIRGECEIQDVITPINSKISLISGGSGLVEFNRLNHFERRSLVDTLSTLDRHYDYLLIDTAPGISDNVLYLNSAAQMIGVVINPDPLSFADSYSLIKVLHQEYRENHFSIICNQVKDSSDGELLFFRFSEVVHRFLNLSLDYWGSIPHDGLVKKSHQNQRLITKHETNSAVALSFHSLREQLEKKSQGSMSTSRKAGLQFFWEQVVGVA